MKKNGSLWRLLAALLLLYITAAYVLLPNYWKHYGPHRELETYPKVNLTAEGFAGDPLNAGLIASEKELVEAMKRAGWGAADALGFSSDFKIAESVLLKHSYQDAPVSRLFLFGRPQDFAFEKQVGGTPRQRHHVRFWKTSIQEKADRAFWIGSATFDRSIGFSRVTGQLTHHIAPDVDKERDSLFQDLTAARQLKKIYQVSGIGPLLNGRNGGGDRYFTDGEITVGVIPSENQEAAEMVKESNPLAVEIKNRSWSFVKNLLQTEKV